MLRQPEKLHFSAAFHRVKKRMPGKVTGGPADADSPQPAEIRFRGTGTIPAVREHTCGTNMQPAPIKKAPGTGAFLF